MARPLFVKPQNSSEWKSSNAQYVKENSSWEKGLLWVKVNGIWEHDHEFTEYVQIQTPTCIKQDIYAYQCICKLDGSMSENHYGSVDLSNHDSDAERVFSQTVNTNSTQHTKQYTCKACGVHDTSWDELENHTPFKAWTYDNDSHWHECLSVTSGCDAQLNKAKHEAESEWQKDTNCHWHWCTSRCGIYLNKEEHDNVSISYGLNANDTEDEKDQRHWRVRNCWTCNLAEYLENEPHSLTSSYSPYMDLTHLTNTWCKLCGHYTKENVEEPHKFGSYLYDNIEHWKKCEQCESEGNTRGTHNKSTHGTFSGKLDYDIHTWYCATDGCDWEEQEAHTLTWNSNSSQHWKQCEVCGAGTGANGNNANNFPLTTPESHSLTSSYSPYMDLTHLTNEWCTVCNYYTKSNEEEPHSFVVNTNQAYVYDFYGHWKECTLCGDSGEYGEHVDSGYVPDPGNNALGHYAYCTICNYLISPTQDHYGSFQESSDGISHYKNCELCGYAIVPSESHTEDTSFWNTDSSDHWRSCKVCAFEMEYTKVAHSGSWSTNSTSHWMNCSTCNYEMVAVAAHTSDWERDSAQHWKYCDTCNYTMVSPTGHDFSGWVTSEDYHWRKCSTCDPNGEAYIQYAGHVEPSTWTTDSSKHYKYCESGCGYLLKSGSHTGSIEWSTDANYHWHDCTTCGYDVDKAAHTIPSTWSDYDTFNHYKYCSDGCGYTVDSGSHTPSNDWSSNATYHWHECSAGCGYDMDKDTHNPQSYWGFYDGTYHYKYCDDCGWNVETDFHTPSSVWSTDNNYHWHECSANCGYDMDKGTHSGSWSYVDDDYHHKLCGTCGWVINDNTPHDAVGGWEYSDTWHWKDCSTCNGRLYYNYHSYSSSITTQPGCTTSGVRTYSCECGRSYTSTIPATGHSEPSSWSSNGTHHYKYCANGCGTTVAKAVHSGTYQYDDNWHWKNCDTCGRSMVSKTNHWPGYSGWYKTLGTYHAYTCECGYTWMHEQGTYMLSCDLCDNM